MSPDSMRPKENRAHKVPCLLLHLTMEGLKQTCIQTGMEMDDS